MSPEGPFRSRAKPDLPVATGALARWLLAARVAPNRDTSLDLSLMPCEPSGALVFFMPIEFRADCSFLYPEHKDAMIRYVERVDFEDLLFFLHGWNKNPASAETDYQNFICRFHGKLEYRPHKRPFPQIEYPPVVRQPSTRLRRAIGRNPSLPSQEIVRRRRRFGRHADPQAKRCPAAPIQVAAACKSQGSG